MDQTSETEKVYQRNKYNEIIEMLLTAGYFRARINTLSEFDKVVGGLCWCITSSGELVDVDILFQENSTIGQKIALSEAVVKALRKMGCPAPLQPHQIQGGVGGSDYPALHSAIVWLIKKYFERRGEREEQLRDISTFQFSKNYQLPVEEFSGVSINLAHILDRSKATRAYKRKETLHESEETRVRSCLLEYGETFATKGGDGSSSSSSGGSKSVTGGDVGGSLSDQIVKAAGKQAEKAKVADAAGGGAGGDGGAGSSGGGTRINLNASAVDVSMAGLSKLDVTELSAFEKQLAKAAAQAKKEELAHAEQASREETEIMKQMSQIDEGTATAVSGSQIGNIVGMGSSEIGSAAAAYQAELEQAKKEMENNLASGKMGQAAAFTRQRQNLTQQRDEFVARGMEAKAASEAMIEKLRVIEEERDEAVEHIEQLRGVLAKLTHLESNSMQQDELVTLKNLVSINEALKAQELAFKASCKAQMQDYMARIKAFDGEADENADENKKLRDIEDIHAKTLAKHNKLRQMLAETNLEVANAVRTIDDIPTRTELIQYERRFVELYQQVAWKLEETRKYYAMYNTLDTSLSFIQKEVKLLNSVSEVFEEAMKTAVGKMEFSKQFETIVRGVEDSLRKQESQLESKDRQVDELKTVHQSLVDEQRKYFKAVKEFQDECNKNDWLMAKLEQLTKG